VAWPNFSKWLHDGMLGWFWVVSIFTYIKPTINHYKKRVELSIRHNIILELHLTPHLVFFS
jgi:hypothetical protein